MHASQQGGLSSIVFDVPNLDDAAVGPEDYRVLGCVLSTLAAYAEHKARAVELRLAGDVECALSHERCMDRLYDALPKWARW